MCKGKVMNTHWRWLAGPILLWALSSRLWAGGSGLNVVVVVNQNSTNSVQLGNYYCEKRRVPPQNYLRINWPGGNTEWTNSDFQNYLYVPLVSLLASQQLTNQIDYIVLSMDLPYRVVQAPDYPNSTTSSLFYGFKPDINPYYPNVLLCSLAPGSSNAYSGSESIFRTNPPISASSNSWLVTMITSTSLTQALAVVDQGVASDGTFPTQTVYLAKSSDRLRNIRYMLFDNTVFNVRLRGSVSIQRTNIDNPSFPSSIQGYENGAGTYTIGSSVFAPGAMADVLTSFGGYLFEYSDQTPLTAFLNAGACCSYGTVTEPCSYFEKFPSSENYFYQARGFSIAESYYQSLTNPYQGVLVGEPLAAPFAQPASGAWSNLPANALLSGATNLSLLSLASDAYHPVQQVDLFVDGALWQTLTNIPPLSGNIVSVTLNGATTNYTVPAGATIKSIASNLTWRLSQTAITNVTRAGAFAHGDRIELRGFDVTKLGAQIPLAVSNSVGSAAALTTFIAATGTNLLDTIAYGYRGYFITNIGSPILSPGAFLQLTAVKTNGVTIVTSVTNSVSTNLDGLAHALFDSVNTNALLTGADGITVEDVNMHEDEPFATYVYGTNDHSGGLNVRARGAGWPASQIQVRVTGSGVFAVTPSTTNRLDSNVTDLQPRAHLYITAGVTNLPLSFAFNTTNWANGFHDLTAVVYEGSHVRTQKHISQTVQIQNGPLSATLTTLVGASNTALSATLQFSVVANTNTISKIELFSTGGSLTNVLNQSSVIFSVAGSYLSLGLHPFYAIVTASNGQQYRTATIWIRLIGTEPPFNVAISTPPPTLSWPATAGRSYDILSATNVTDVFQAGATVIPSNSAAQWTDTNPAAPQRFYRVRTSN